MSYLYMLFGKVLLFIYGIVGNYGVAVVLFAVFARLILLPVTYKQTKSTQIMKIINPEVQKVQERYKNDKAKQGEEMMKVYDKYNYNPMSGCLPLFIQMPILLGLFGVIRNPHLYVFTEGMGDVSMSFLWLSDITKSAMDVIGAEGFSMAGVCALIIPMINVIATYVQQKQAMESNPSNGQMGGQMAMMQNMMTIFIGYMSLKFPGALAIYWAATTILTVGQTMFMNKFIPVTAESLNVKPVVISQTEVSTDNNGKNKKKRRKR